MTFMTPEQFLAEREPDETDVPFHGANWAGTPGFDLEPLEPGAATALESIALSLQSLADVVVRRSATEEAEDQAQQLANQLDAEYAELKAEADAKQALLDEVLAICKPSTSKLANSIRAALVPGTETQTEESGSGGSETGSVGSEAQQPAHDAPIEEWVAFARAKGIEVDPGRTNRSQIRTALSIPHVNGSVA